MEPNEQIETPINNDNIKNNKRLKIATGAASIIAICGISFGIYGVVQGLQKDEQISKKDSQIATLEDQIKNTISTNDVIKTIEQTIVDKPELKTCTGEYSGTAATSQDAQTKEFIMGKLTIKLAENGTYELTKENINGASGNYIIVDNTLLLKTAPELCDQNNQDCSTKYTQFLTISEDCSEITSGYGSYFFNPDFKLSKQ